MTTQQVKDVIDEARASEVRIAFQDDLGNEKGVALVDRSMRIEELQREAPLFGLDAGEYGLYRAGEDQESVRLDPRQTVGEALGDVRAATLRYAPEMHGAGE